MKVGSKPRIMCDYFGIPTQNPQQPIVFPITLSLARGQDEIENWFQETLIRECVAYRKRSSFVKDNYEYRLYTCHMANWRKTPGNAQKVCGCTHDIEVRIYKDQNIAVISSKHPEHTNHTPGTIEDISHLRLSRQTLIEIEELYLQGLKPI